MKISKNIIQKSLLTCIMMVLASNVTAKPLQLAAPEDVKKFPNIIQNVVQAYKQLDLDVEVTYFPIKRSLLMADEHPNYDGEIGRISNAESTVTKLVRIPVPIVESAIVALTYLPDMKIRRMHNLHNYRTGTMRGVLATETLMKPYHPIEANNLAHSLDLLTSKRIDIYVTIELFADKLLNNPRTKTLHKINLPTEPLKFYHYIRKKNQHLIPKLTVALEKITGRRAELN